MNVKLFLAFAMLVAPGAAQRGAVDGLSVATDDARTGRAVTLNVRGINPCGAVEIDPGDGNVVVHPLTQVPATVTHTYMRPGNYQIRARGMGNCDGQARASINVTGPDLTQAQRDEDRAAARRAEDPARALEEPLSRRGSTIDVDAREGWTHTGVVVREGDMVRLEASGEIVFAQRAARVGPDGSSQARVRNAPFSNRPAGALIARIGEGGLPVFVGASEHTLRADRDGVLWLGINDGSFGDNAGAFRVRVSDASVAADDPSGPGRGWARGRGRGAGVGRGGAAGDVEWEVTVPARDGWVDTGVMLREGDMLRLDAQGTILLTNNTADSADPAGSRSRVAPNAPFPSRPAGALLARIGQGTPIFVGARQQTVRVMENGTLWLGVNDDHFGDNSGEFTVRITVTTR